MSWKVISIQHQVKILLVWVFVYHKKSAGFTLSSWLKVSNTLTLGFVLAWAIWNLKVKMSDVNNLVFDRFLCDSRSTWVSSNMEDRDQTDQEDDTKRTGVHDSSSEISWFTDKGYVKRFSVLSKIFVL